MGRVRDAGRGSHACVRSVSGFGGVELFEQVAVAVEKAAAHSGGLGPRRTAPIPGTGTCPIISAVAGARGGRCSTVVGVPSGARSPMWGRDDHL
jgi:hypothetical protein